MKKNTKNYLRRFSHSAPTVGKFVLGILHNILGEFPYKTKICLEKSRIYSSILFKTNYKLYNFGKNNAKLL